MQLNSYKHPFACTVYFFLGNTINPIAKMLSKLDKGYIIKILLV